MTLWISVVLRSCISRQPSWTAIWVSYQARGNALRTITYCCSCQHRSQPDFSEQIGGCQHLGAEMRRGAHADQADDHQHGCEAGVGESESPAARRRTTQLRPCNPPAQPCNPPAQGGNPAPLALYMLAMNPIQWLLLVAAPTESEHRQHSSETGLTQCAMRLSLCITAQSDGVPFLLVLLAVMELSHDDVASSSASASWTNQHQSIFICYCETKLNAWDQAKHLVHKLLTSYTDYVIFVGFAGGTKQ